MMPARTPIRARLGKYFLRRLRRQCEDDALTIAVDTGLLTEAKRIVEGIEVRVFTAHPAMLGKSDAEIERMLRRLGDMPAKPAASDSTLFSFDDEAGVSNEGVVPSLSKRNARKRESDGSGARTGGAPPLVAHRALTARLLRDVGRMADRPRAAEVATLLLLARSLSESGVTIEETLRTLRLPKAIVTVTGAVPGFEDCFLDLLGGGFVLPGKVASSNGFELFRDIPIRFSGQATRWRVIVFPGSKFDPDEADRADRRVGRAALLDYPILGIAEREERLPERLRSAAQLNLTCGPLDMAIIRETIIAVLGEETEGGICHADCSLLTLTDLAIAIRPGVSVTHALDVLGQIAASRRKSIEPADGDGDDQDGRRKSSGQKAQSSNTNSKSGRGKDQGSGSEIIQPVKPTGDTVQDAFIASVESLSGYGEARGWALSLKADLALWRDGRLEWDDMSAKLLLSGPPGTGKTTFARALCNTLQVPLIVTSVATWLEPGYLGDVLKRMKAAFAEAEAHKPAILFVDEIDGIGKRQDPSREYADYWNAVVNQALTLLDGAVKSSGVVVLGATNNPDQIDAALLRSGRLEKHIAVPRPDTEALIGILRHHLRSDVDAVVASAPPELARGAETQPVTADLGKPRQTINHEAYSVLQEATLNGEI
jgi:hypothetical protein